MPTKYGPNGSRWWVGQNVGQTGLVGSINDAPSGYESLPSGNATDDALFASAAAKDKGSKTPVTISVENIKWYNIQGPYTSQAAANAAIPAIQAGSPAQGTVKQLAGSGLPVVAPVASALNTAQSWEQALIDFLQGLTSANLWIRVAKVTVGGVILIVGISKLTGLDEKAGSIASKAVKIAPFL